MDVLFDGKFSHAAIFAFGLVDASVGTTADEADNLVALIDPLLGVVPCEHGLCGVCRV